MTAVTIRCMEFNDLVVGTKFYFLSGIGGKYPEKPEPFVKTDRDKYQYPDKVEAPVQFHIPNLKTLVVVAEGVYVQIDQRGPGGQVTFW